jgi:glycosyltransferase involved in cell wall biosynthesis
MMDRVRDWMECFSARYCDAITCPSRALSVWVAKKWRPKSSIVVIPNFVETVFPKAKTSMNRKGKIVLFMGSLAILKGFDVFLNALPILLRETNAECHIVGRKTSSWSLNCMLEEALSHWERVKYLGFLEGTAKMKELEQSDLVVIPSLWENFPMTCIEAMASSKVVVASEVGGLKDIISDGINGFLVPAGNHQILASAIKEALLMDPIQRERVENNAKRTVETRYVSSVIGKTMIDFYLCVAEHKKT